jgi:hypothetical protein
MSDSPKGAQRPDGSTMTCVDVVREMITRLKLQSAELSLLEHPVMVNWRVRNQTLSDKLTFLVAGLEQQIPERVVAVSGADIIRDDFTPERLLRDVSNVISLSSRVHIDGEHKHLALMNLHPEEDLSYEDITRIVRLVTSRMPGYLLTSGRFYHFYGLRLLSVREWNQFIAAWLMPTIIVSPRYVGHSLYRGYATLRLTTNPTYKPSLPTASALIDGD